MFEVNVEDVPHWIDERAQIVADSYESGDLYKAVQDECEEFAHGWVGRALAIIYWDGAAFDALDCCMCTSPMENFIDAVNERAKELLGIED